MKLSCFCGLKLRNIEALQRHGSAKLHWFCPYCNISFDTRESYEEHDLSPHGCSCDNCRKSFSTKYSLIEHKSSTGHCFCLLCGLAFTTESDLRRHRLDFHKLQQQCGKCKTWFSHERKVKRHQRLTGHCYCGDCDQSFADDESLAQHRRSSGHASDFRCCDCNRSFCSSYSLERHLSRKKHGVPPETKSDNRCDKCKRNFKNKKSLQTHLESLVHKPLTDLRCIADGCNRRFSAPSSMIQHLESGACKSGMTREKLNRLVLANDVDKIISSGDVFALGKLDQATKGPSREISNGEWTPSTGSGGVILTPESGLMSATLTPQAGSTLGKLGQATKGQCREISSGEWTPSTESGGVILTPKSCLTPATLTPREGSPPSDLGEAVARAISLGSRCPLCPKTRPPFSKPESLRMHLNSQAHAPKIFHCPTALAPTLQTTSSGNKTIPIKYFATVSGLTAHVESGICQGGKASLLKAAEYIESRLMGMGMTVKLITKVDRKIGL